MHRRVYHLEGSSDTETATETDTDGDTYRQYDESPSDRIRAAPPRLPPLSIQNKRGQSRLPPLETRRSFNNMAESGGGDTLISLPEPKGPAPKQTEKGIISVPGDDEDEVAVRNSGTSQKSSGKPLDIVIYFMDKSGINLSVEDGHRADAGELFEMVMEEMNFPDEARKVFSLWLVSDLLELQLKPNHVPFKLTCQWDELLEKYTTTDEDDIERDEPVIMFQKNVFYPLSEEKKLDDPQIIRLLYHEAKENVVDGRYPVDQDQCDLLAGVQALITHGAYGASQHTPEFYKSSVDDFYPEHMCKRRWTFPGFKAKDNPEYRLSLSHRAATQKYGPRTKESLLDLHKAYLKFAWMLPYYGAAFFNGQIEHPSKFKIMGSQDDPVYVAINTRGVFVIDMDKVNLLLGLLYKEMSWEYAEPHNKENPDCLPCLFLQFEAEEEEQRVSKLLQIFSKEAVMMDALIEACVGMNSRRQAAAAQGGGDEVDTSQLMSRTGHIEEEDPKSGGDAWKKYNRLCLSTFNNSGGV